MAARGGPGDAADEALVDWTATVLGNASDDTGGGSCTSGVADDSQELVPEWLVMVGTVMVIAASFISCFGVNLQKHSHNKNEGKELEDRQSMCKSKVWLCGMALMVTGSILDMLALPFVPMSRVSALGATGMVANIMITPLFLGEKLTRHDLLGGVVVVLGTTFACIYGASEEPAITSDCLLELFTYPLFLVYLSISLVACAAMYYLMIGFMEKQAQAVKAGLVVEHIECVAAWEQLDDFRRLPENPRFPFFFQYGPQFYPVVFAVFAGIVGSWGVMLSKALLIFFKNGVTNTQVLSSWLLLLAFLFPTATCVFSQVKYLNYSLTIYRDALFILPVYQSMWISAGIISGMVFYREYEGIADIDMMVFIMGVLVALIGIVIMAHRESATTAVPSPEPSPKAGDKPADMLNGATAPPPAPSASIPTDVEALRPVATPTRPQHGSFQAGETTNFVRCIADSFNLGGTIHAHTLQRSAGTTPSLGAEDAPLLGTPVAATPLPIGDADEITRAE